MNLLGSTTPTAFMASVTSAVGTSFDSVYVLVAMAIALPLAFWIIHKVIALFPKTGGRRA